jgi:hypothetical protein
LVDYQRQSQTVEELARQTIELLSSSRLSPRPGDVGGAAPALERLATLLHAELQAHDDETELLLLYARTVAETWLTAHVTLLLGQAGIELLRRRRLQLEALTDPRVAGDPGGGACPVTLLDLARQLDEHVYGAADRPRAFQRHLRSFFEEIDVAGADGSAALLDAQVRERTSAATRADVLRVSLWVVLFVTRYYFDAVSDPERSAQTYALFERLRDATAAFYEERGRL